MTSVVIAMVLLMVLLANGVAARWSERIRGRWVWALLGGSVLLSLAWNEAALPFESPAARGIGTTLVVSLTFLFAGLIFARAFARTRLPSAALGFNVLGAVVGGLLEYLGLITGLRALAALALALYFAAMICEASPAAPSADAPTADASPDAG